MLLAASNYRYRLSHSSHGNHMKPHLTISERDNDPRAGRRAVIPARVAGIQAPRMVLAHFPASNIRNSLAKCRMPLFKRLHGRMHEQFSSLSISVASRKNASCFLALDCALVSSDSKFINLFQYGAKPNKGSAPLTNVKRIRTTKLMTKLQKHSGTERHFDRCRKQGRAFDV